MLAHRNEERLARRPASNNSREKSGEKAISRHELRDDFCGNDTGQFLFETLKLECKPFVIDAEQSEDGRIEVADMDRVFHDVIAKVVCDAVGDSGFGAAAGHPNRKATRMMVAAIVVFREATLAVNSAAEFAAPEYERVVEESAALQIGDEGVGGAIRRGGKFWQIADR